MGRFSKVVWAAAESHVRLGVFKRRARSLGLDGMPDAVLIPLADGRELSVIRGSIAYNDERSVECWLFEDGRGVGDPLPDVSAQELVALLVAGGVATVKRGRWR